MMVRYLFSVLSAFVILGSVSMLKAQSPDQQIGVGVTVGSGGSGATFAYALNPGLHIGTGFGFGNSSQSGQSSTSIIFAPYVKGLFKGTKDFVPFVQGQFSVVSSSVGGTSSTRTGLALMGGAEYFASKNIGVYGTLSVLELGFDPAVTTFGIGANVSLGVEWFL